MNITHNISLSHLTEKETERTSHPVKYKNYIKMILNSLKQMKQKF